MEISKTDSCGDLFEQSWSVSGCNIVIFLFLWLSLEQKQFKRLNFWTAFIFTDTFINSSSLWVLETKLLTITFLNLFTDRLQFVVLNRNMLFKKKEEKMRGRVKREQKSLFNSKRSPLNVLVILTEFNQEIFVLAQSSVEVVDVENHDVFLFLYVCCLFLLWFIVGFVPLTFWCLLRRVLRCLCVFVRAVLRLVSLDAGGPQQQSQQTYGQKEPVDPHVCVSELYHLCLGARTK